METLKSRSNMYPYEYYDTYESYAGVDLHILYTYSSTHVYAYNNILEYVNRTCT
jgi:hypothetical protein